MRLLHKTFIFSCVLLFVACSNPFNPEISNNTNMKRDYVYQPNTPDNVLRNLMLAYNQRDLENYKICLDESFSFQV